MNDIYEINIKKVQNGYILKYDDGDQMKSRLHINEIVYENKFELVDKINQLLSELD